MVSHPLRGESDKEPTVHIGQRIDLPDGCGARKDHAWPLCPPGARQHRQPLRSMGSAPGMPEIFQLVEAMPQPFVGTKDPSVDFMHCQAIGQSMGYNDACSCRIRHDDTAPQQQGDMRQVSMRDARQALLGRRAGV